MNSNPPSGFSSAVGQVASKAPTLADIRRGSYGSDASSERRASVARQGSFQSVAQQNLTTPATPTTPSGTRSRGNTWSSGIDEAAEDVHDLGTIPSDHAVGRKAGPSDAPVSGEDSSSTPAPAIIADEKPGTVDSSTNSAGPENHYIPPPKHSKGVAFKIAMKSFYKFCLTPIGFLVLIYGLNVVAWGGMLFLLLCNASKYMDHPDKDYINSGRRVWIEIDSQILNALFCVTGLGLIPWRFRDFYYLLKWRNFYRQGVNGEKRNHEALRHLAGIHAGWFRLEGSETIDPSLDFKGDATKYENRIHGAPEFREPTPEVLTQLATNPALPIPLNKSPDPPLTGLRAPPSLLWKMDFVVWAFVWNTFLQIVLCGLMWGLNRYDRPGWSTGLFICLACIIAMFGGWMQFKEGKRIKAVEGLAWTAEDLLLDEEHGAGAGHGNMIMAASDNAAGTSNFDHVSGAQHNAQAGIDEKPKKKFGLFHKKEKVEPESAPEVVG
jgi:Protein of unknown function (DUF2985)